MIGARIHALSLGATLLALVVGVVVGAGPLADEAEQRRSGQLQRLQGTERDLRGQVADLHRQVAAGDGFVRDVAPALTAGRLSSRTVAVFGLPGASDDEVATAVRAVRRAGAGVPITLRLADVYVDPAQARSPLEDLSLRLVPPGVDFADGSTAIERVGTVLARATVVGRGDGDNGIDQPAAELLAGLEELGAVETEGAPGRRADLAVLVAPDDASWTGAAPGDTVDAAARDGATEALLGLAVALDEGGRGAVVVGGPGAAARGGFVAAVRDGGEAVEGVSSVDGAGSRAGVITLVLALAEQMDGGAGAYGTGPGAAAVLPPFRLGESGES
ncbi:MAG: copper transporter [Actinomycetes bacterium]